MAVPLKGSRLITVDGAVYRWYVRRRPSYIQGLARSPLTFAVELAGRHGRVLVVSVTDVRHPGNWLHQPSLAVRPAVVAAVIRMALDRGWQPAGSGAPFRLKVPSHEFPEAARTTARSRWT
jgi:hypothetical protein